jgi:chromosome segregation protein
MYISELELQGFKSFAYKTDVKFDRGITAIVGPNGCGKSNIVDSMRWVLGEQRPTLLRSSSMANVIFNGTAQKNALGLAEVSLTFVNNKGLLPTEYSEVTITRRLYRSGESEYLINGTSCRLKDIMELFMDTGMSSDAYSVIELKMVEEILTNKNNDRRRLFEEAAGVTRYKDKRKKTLRKLDSTNTDLQRVEDLLSEIRKKVHSLERQAERAQKAKKYRAELDHLDKALSKYKYNTIQDELEPLKKRISNADKEKKEILSKIKEFEQAEEEARQALNEKERNQSEAQRRVSQLANSVREAETNLKITRGKIGTEQNIIEQYSSDIAQGEQDLKELRELFESSKKQLDSFDKELKTAQKNLESSKERYGSIQQEYSSERDDLVGIVQAYDDANHELSQLQTKRIKIETRLENRDEEIDRLKIERKNLSEEIDRLVQAKDALSENLEEAQNEREQKETELLKSKQKREGLSQKQNELKDTIRQQQSRLHSVESEIDLLQDIASSNEAFPSSVKYLLENNAADFPLIQVVSNIISTDEKHAVALEAVLGNVLNFVVVESLDDAKKAARILKDNNKGQATFIPLGQLAASYNTHPQSLADKVDTDSTFKALNQLLLGQVIVCETVEDAYENIQDGVTAVTKEGEVVTGKQFLKSGSTGKNAGTRVGLKDKIEKLEKEASRLNKEIAESKNELDKLQKSHQQINIDQREKALSKSREEVRKIEGRANSLTSKIQIYRDNIKELKRRSEALAESNESSGEELKKLEPRKKELEATLEKLTQEQKKKKETLKKLEEERSIAQSRFNDARLKHQNLQNKVENHERDIKRAEEGIKSIKERIELRTEKKEEAKNKIETLKKTIAQVEKKLKSDKEKKKEADSTLEAAQESSARQRGKINEIEKELKEVRRQKEVNMELVHHLSMAKEKFEMQANNISDHVWETYETLMDQIEVGLPEDKEPDEAKERISWLRQKLNKIGEVNALAIEEFDEEKERLDFYEEQIADLEKAQRELRETIDEINKTATKRFNKTFEKIRTNFQDVFHTLFNEDDFCDLTIEEDAEDPLEAKIEIEANPRGKRPSTINQLSGGEKTLTAIALLFAIYLVKPSPFCVLDEVDAPLDDANIERFSNMIKRFSEKTQFIIITHNKKTMGKAEMMYGVTMPETGISRLVGVRLDEVAEA